STASGVKSSRYSCGRSVLNHSTHSAVAISTWLTSRHGPCRRINSFLNDPTVVSARALSSASPTDPTDGSMPSARSRPVNATEVYWLPASLLSRTRLNSDYAEVGVKPRNRGMACRAGFAEGSRPSAGVNDDGRRFFQELPTQRRKDYARANTSITHRPDPWRDRRLVRRPAGVIRDHRGGRAPWCAVDHPDRGRG